MSDLISRSELINALKVHFDSCFREDGELLYSDHICTSDDVVDLIKLVENQPTAYSVDRVVEELEERKALHERLVEYENKNGTVTEKYQHIKAIDVLNDAIEIVKQCGISDDVCEWKAGKSNGEWQPNCETNSTYNVFGVAWFRKCPYCGKKIKVVE